MTDDQPTPKQTTLAPRTMKGGPLAGQTGKVQLGVIGHCDDVTLTGDVLTVEDFRTPALSIDAFICEGEAYDISEIMEVTETGASVGTRSSLSIAKSPDTEHVKQVLSYYERCLRPEEPVERTPLKKFIVRAHRLDGQGRTSWEGLKGRDRGNAVPMARALAVIEGRADKYDWDDADVVEE